MLQSIALFFLLHAMTINLTIVPGNSVNVFQISNCSQDILAINSSLEYCSNQAPLNQSWYQSQADCKRYGGELISLEWPEKMLDFQEYLAKLGGNISKIVFVNAHKQFYSGNGKFKWKSGIVLEISKNEELLEECVYVENSSFINIPCDEDKLILLICQRTSQILIPYSVPVKRISKTQIKYTNTICEYFTYISSTIKWYEALLFCEWINSELIGIPNKEECHIISSSKSLARNLFIYLNLHPFTYKYFNSELNFTDLKSIEPICNGSNEIDRNDLCVRLSINDMILRSVHCETNSSRSTSIGFICKQCRPIVAQNVSANNCKCRNYVIFFVLLDIILFLAVLCLAFSVLYCKVRIQELNRKLITRTKSRESNERLTLLEPFSAIDNGNYNYSTAGRPRTENISMEHASTNETSGELYSNDQTDIYVLAHEIGSNRVPAEVSINYLKLLIHNFLNYQNHFKLKAMKKLIP